MHREVMYPTSGYSFLLIQSLRLKPRRLTVSRCTYPKLQIFYTICPILCVHTETKATWIKNSITWYKITQLLIVQISCFKRQRLKCLHNQSFIHIHTKCLNFLAEHGMSFELHALIALTKLCLILDINFEINFPCRVRTSY